MADEAPRILPCGDAALSAEFGDTVDPTLNARVMALDAALRGEDGVVETAPTYRSLLVRYDPARIGHALLSARIRSLAGGAEAPVQTGRTWTVPVAYGGTHGIDLEDVAAAHAITPDELVRRHAAPLYHVYMIGFLPGFAYLGGLDPSIATPRRLAPRLTTPAGTISIGGVQALVASIAAPSGWHLLGRTPMRNFVPDRDPAVLIRAGDRVRFRPIDHTSFTELDRAAASGAPIADER